MTPSTPNSHKQFIMENIDIENWKRKEHFAFFYRMDYPQYNICMDLDITNFLAYVKKHNMSFYYAMIYASTVMVNQVENFRYRIRDGKVVLHDKVHPSYTDMDKESTDDLFKYISLDLTDDIIGYCRAATEKNERQKSHFVAEEMSRDDLIYITSIPWISFTHISHTITINRNDSVPRISWGKYYKTGDRVMLPFSVQAHHALVDGIHIGKYIEKLQAYLDHI